MRQFERTRTIVVDVERTSSREEGEENEEGSMEELHLVKFLAINTSCAEAVHFSFSLSTPSLHR